MVLAMAIRLLLAAQSRLRIAQSAGGRQTAADVVAECFDSVNVGI